MILGSHDGNIGIYHAPKAASRTLIAWLVLAEFPELYEEHPDWFLESRNKSVGEYGQIRKLVRVIDGRHDWGGKTVPQVDCPIRIAVVRDPVTRFLDGFVNRAVYHNGMKNDLNWFIENFDRLYKESSDIAQHFRPQHWFYGTDKSIFTHLFPISEIAEVKAVIERVTGCDELPMLNLQQSNGIPIPVPTPEQRAWIERRYAIDTVIFGRQSL